MYCKYCGKEINDVSEFCQYCGKKLNLKLGSEIPKPIVYKEESTSEDTESAEKANLSVDKGDTDLGEQSKENFAYVDNKKLKKKSKRIVIIPLVLLIIVGSFFGVTIYAYNLADSGEFEEASKFESLFFWDWNYKDYVKSGIKLNSGEYGTAIRNFKSLGSYRNSQEFYKESIYRQSIEYYEEKEYFDAYDGFVSLNDYKSAYSYVKRVKDGAYVEAKNDFDSKLYFSARELFELSGRNDSDKYIKVINVLLSNSSIDPLKNMMDFVPARECLVSDHSTAVKFLQGSWYSWDSYWYFTMDSSGQTSFNIPHTVYGDHYYIDNGIYYLHKGEDRSTRRNTFVISVNDWNTIKIKSNKDGNTYLLYRS